MVQAPTVEVAAAVIRDEAGRYLIARRRRGTHLEGLWEFPGGKCEPGESLEKCLWREIRDELEFEIAVGAPVTVVKHAYSHFRITLHAFECRPVSGRPRAVGVAAFKWVRMSELDRYAFAATDRKIIQRMRAGG